MSTGLNDNAAVAAINNIVSNGATVRLMTQAVAYDDNASDLDAKEVSETSYDSVSVPEADWGITADVANDQTTLENNAEIDFGEAQQDWGTVVEAVIQDGATDSFIITGLSNDATITDGTSVSFPSGAITYTLD